MKKTCVGTQTSTWKITHYQGGWDNDKRHGRGSVGWFGSFFVRGNGLKGRGRVLCSPPCALVGLCVCIGW